MHDGPRIASIAALIGDPGRANMLTALMDGRALTASELGGAAGVTIQTASGHLSRMVEASLLNARAQGRNRFYRLASTEVAHAIESLMALAGTRAAPASKSWSVAPANDSRMNGQGRRRSPEQWA